MRKAIATQTIIYLILGVLVLVGLGYLVWSKLIDINRPLDETECNARQIAYCTKLSQCD